MYECFELPEDDFPKDTPSSSKNGPVKTCIPGHLSSPIYSEEVDMILGNEIRMFSCSRHRKIKTFLEDPRFNNITSIYTLSDPYGKLHTWVENNVTIFNGKKLLSMISETLYNWALHKMHLLHPYKDLNSITKQDLYNEFLKKAEIVSRSIQENLYLDFMRMKKVETLKDNICFKEIPRGNFTEYNGILYAERDLCIVKIKGQWYLSPTTLFLGACDRLQSLFPLKLYWLICDHFNKYPNHSMFKRGEELIQIFTKLREKLIDKFFAFISCWEALMIGWVIKQDDDLGFDSLFVTQQSEMLAILQSNKINDFSLDSILPNSNTSYNIMMHLELTGISKSFGYPTLKAEALLDQLRDYGTQNIMITNDETISNVAGILRRDFCINFRKKKHIYPNIERAPTELITYLTTNRPIPEDLMKVYTLWEKVKFKKTLDYDYTPDQTELIKDSSTALPLHMWKKQYDKCAFYIRYNQKPTQYYTCDPVTTRAIESFLNSTPDKVRKLIMQREQGIYDENDHVAVMCGKELELKENSGRAFTKQTYNQRLVQTSMEHNIAEKIFPYVPEQSMTDGEISLTIKTMTHVKDLDNGNAFIALDLTKWCLFQRLSTTIIAGQMYDELFGFNGLFTNSHSFFIDCNILCNSRLCPPEVGPLGMPKPGPFFLNRFIGGMEGMQQKKWTHIAIAAIRLSLEKLSLKGYIMGQGDNQIVVLFLSASTISEKRSIIEKFLSVLISVMVDIHHKVKDKETWYSQNLYEYGKSRIYKGANISQGTKRAARAIPDINDGLFSITSSISTLNTITESIARGDTNPDPAFMCNQFLIANYLIRKNIGKNSKELQTLLMFPADFGGIPLSTLYSHSVRGFDDKVSLWLSIRQFGVRPYNTELLKLIDSIWQTHPYRPAASALERTRLFKDPYSLNIKSLPSADTEIKNMTLEYLKSDKVTNPVIRKLYTGDATLSEKSLIQMIDKIEPLFVQVCHEMLVCSNAGLLIRLQQKLTNTKTVENLVRMTEGVSLISLINEKNDQLVTIIKTKLRGQNIIVDKILLTSECITVQANQLRSLSWGRKLFSLTKPPYQCQVSMYCVDTPGVILENCIQINVNDGILTNPLMACYGLGPYKPYIGSSTQEKIKKPSIEITEKTSFLKALLRLGKLKSWFKIMEWGDIMYMINLLIDEKLQVIELPPGLDDIEQIFPQVMSGNITHRFQADMESSYAVVNCIPTITSHFSQTTNRMKAMTSEGEDYNIFYQLMFISNVILLNTIGGIYKELRPSYIIILNCPTCTIEVTKEQIKSISTQGNIIPISSGIEQVSHLNSQVRSTWSHSNIDIKLLLEFTIGIEISKNIDLNYQVFHQHGGLNEMGEFHMVKANLSLNDLRCCNLRNVLAYSFLYSSHSTRLTASYHSPLSCNSNDRSFLFLAECIMNAGLIEECFLILNLTITEHTMATQYLKFSTLISRNVSKFYCEILKEGLLGKFNIYPFQFPNALMSNELSRILRCFTTLNFKQLSNENINLLKRWLSNGKTYNVLFYLKVGNPTYVPFNKENVINIWRSEAIKNPLLRAPNHQFKLATPATDDYSYSYTMPLSSLLGFYNQRVININELRFFSFKVLCYAARPLGSISSAASKFMEIILLLGLKENFDSDEEKFCYTLAEGSGSVNACLISNFPSVKTFYNTLMLASVDLRDDPTNGIPPALLNLPGKFREQFLEEHSLCFGTTNILDPIFYNKLKNALTQYPGYLVTIDAESSDKSTNLEFVENLLPLLIDSNVKIVIIKIFLYSNIEPFISKLIPSTYEYVIVKPASSNPIGCESYLCVWNTYIKVNNFNVSQLKQLYPTLLKIFSNNDNHLLSEKEAESYINLCRETYKALITNFPSKDCHLVSQYEWLKKKFGLCSLICKNIVQFIHDSIDFLHTSKSSSNIANISSRKGGINKAIRFHLMTLLFLLTCYQQKQSALKTMIRLSYFGVIENIEDARSSSDGNFFIFGVDSQNPDSFINQWDDLRQFIRELVNSKPCNCTKINYIIYSKHHKEQSLIYKKVKRQLSDIGISPMVMNSVFCNVVHNIDFNNSIMSDGYYGYICKDVFPNIDD